MISGNACDDVVVLGRSASDGLKTENDEGGKIGTGAVAIDVELYPTDDVARILGTTAGREQPQQRRGWLVSSQASRLRDHDRGGLTTIPIDY